jgi:hypothetical protein
MSFISGRFQPILLRLGSENCSCGLASRCMLVSGGRKVDLDQDFLLSALAICPIRWNRGLCSYGRAHKTLGLVLLVAQSGQLSIDGPLYSWPSWYDAWISTPPELAARPRIHLRNRLHSPTSAHLLNANNRRQPPNGSEAPNPVN